MSWLMEENRSAQKVLDPSAATQSMLRAVQHVNAQLLRVLMDIAELPRADFPPSIIALGRALKQVEPAARDRLAHCPFFLVDAGFHDAARWRAAREALEHPAAEGASEAGDHGKRIRLARSTLLTAWDIIRVNPEAADLILGASTECSRVISACTFPELQEMAERHFEWVRPRWETRLENWYRLISVAQSPPGSLASVGLRGLFLLGGEFVADESV